MPDRSWDWFHQAERDLEQAEDSKASKRSPMPVRSLSSSVLAWPDARTVDDAVRQWATRVGAQDPSVSRIGYFGSYARGDWGVGSDLDVVVVVEDGADATRRGASAWDMTVLPVPTDLLVFTVSQWQALVPQSRMGRMLRDETIWVYVKR